MKKRKIKFIITILSVLLFLGCVFFLIYYLILQPQHSREVTNKYRKIYYSYDNSIQTTDKTTNNKEKKLKIKLDKKYASEKNADGILLKFERLYKYNSDIKGWLKIPGTNIDYPVMQSFNGSDFYLKRDFEGNTDKNGSLYIDGNCNVEDPSKNIVIHGHNMDTTGMMFHELLKYNDIHFYMQHPVITFDSIYKESQWKIIAYIKVSGNMNENTNFNYLRGSFKNKEDFMNFVYQIEMRSLYYCPVDVNEKDRLLMLSTCSYEANNYRTVLIARKVRKKEEASVNTSTAYLRDSDVLYSKSYYAKHGGIAPQVFSFAEEMSFGTPEWYSGKIKYDSVIGNVYAKNHYLYRILSKTDVEFAGHENGNIKELNIPSTVELNGRTFDVTKIAKDSLIYAYRLESIKIGNKITSIPDKCFYNCHNLKTISFGEAVSGIGKKACYQLEHLKTVKFFCSDLKYIGEKAFKRIDPKVKFKIRKGKLKSYTSLIKKSQVPEKAKYYEYTN